MYKSFVCAGAGLLLAATSFSSIAAERQELALSKSQLATRQSFTSQSQFAGLLRLEASGGLQEIDRRVRKDGTVHYRFQQTYQGVPVYGDHILITTSKSGIPRYLSGSVVQGIAADVGATRDQLVSADHALETALNHYRKQIQVADLAQRQTRTRLYVQLDSNDKARFIYEVSFFTLAGGQPAKPVYLIDAASGTVIRHYEGLNTAEAGGPGGNRRMGYVEYGQNNSAYMDVTRSGSSCYMENSKVRVVDMQGGTSEITSPAVSYYCGTDNYHREYENNGSFGYNNDALFGGTAFVDMMQNWYGEAALPFKLVQRTNFNRDYANAYWDGSKMTYGNGGSTFHHMGTYGVIGHEVAHGYTQFHSNLAYYNQSGGINESFSDMAGETLKYYILGENDFIVGSLLKKNSGFMRNMKNPPADGYSIDHTSRYYSGIDVHHSSGVFNKAFYLLATTSGWDTRKAFEVFLIANRDYWRPNDDYQSAGNGACQAAAFLGYDGAALKAAFNQVGVAATACSAAPSEPEELISGTPRIVSGTEKENLRYFIQVPPGATRLTVTTSGNNGDADLYLKFATDPSDSNYDCGSFGETSNESCTISNPQAGEWRVLVHAWAAISNIQLTATVEGASGGSSADIAVNLVGATGRVQKAADGSAVVRYKAVVSNAGPGTASGVQLRNIFPSGVALRSVTNPRGSCSSDGVICDLGTMTAGATAEVMIEVGVTDKERRQFGATVSAATADSNGDNNLDAEKFGGALGALLLALGALVLRRITGSKDISG